MKVDYYKIEELLTQEERLVTSTVKKFTQDIMPVIQKCFREHRPFPVDIVREMGKLGLFGSTIEGYGCPGMSYVVYGLICQELEHGDSALRSFVSVQSSLVMYPIYTFGSPEQKRYWLPKLATGEKIGCFGLTEPDFGSNPGGLQTRAVRDGNHYVLNGTKLWISNGSIADVAVIWAKTEDNVIRGFLVERTTPGFSTSPIEGKFSLRAQDTAELVLADCRIPEKNMLPEAKGIKAPLSCLTQARYGIAWGVMGAAISCYETVLSYAKERIQFDKPIAAFQLVQQKLVRMITEITKGQLLALRLGRLMDEGRATYAQVSMAKLNNVHEALKIAREARDILGAYGIVDEYPIIRHMLNLESVYTYEGTHDIQLLIVGSDITGLRAFT
ncbi:MAG TPA: acyl-CoA dehydrogenase [bacterium (Candidatus Stahlbacteria)]|nr:acyl-CoA dehydrogenase [Candidatus Stahlbacteria bacterium]